MHMHSALNIDSVAAPLAQPRYKIVHTVGILVLLQAKF